MGELDPAGEGLACRQAQQPGYLPAPIYDPYGQQQRRQVVPTVRYVEAPRRRKVWPWVLLAIVMIPVLGFVACTALVGGAISAVDQARKGGTVAIGETFTYESGLALVVAAPKPHKADNEFIVGPDERAYEATVVIANGTDHPLGATLITMNATVNGSPAQQLFDETAWPTQDIAVGQQLVVPFRFKVKDGTSGSLQIAVTDAFNEPVFFTGTL